MKHRLLLLLLLLLPAWAAQAQVPLAQETFETDGEGTRYTTTVPSGNFTTLASNPVQRYFVRTNVNPLTNPGGSVLFGNTNFPTTLGNVQGSYYYAGERAGLAASPATVQLNQFSTVGYGSLKVTVALADARGPSWAGTSTYLNGATQDAPADKIVIEYSTDGGSTYLTAGQFVGTASTTTTPGYLRLDTDKNGVIDSNDGAQSATNTLDINFRDYTFDIAASSATTVVRISFNHENERVEAAFDNIRVTGVVNSVAAPTLANIEGTTLTYAEGSVALQITNTLTVSASTNVTKATVTIGAGRSTGDALNLPTTPGISSSYDAPTGVLTLTGSASAAAYQAALQTVTFYNPDANNVTPGTRNVSFIAYTGTGGTSGSNAQSRNVQVTAALSGPTSLPYLEDFESNTGEGTNYASNTFTGSSGAAWLRTNNPNYLGSRSSTSTTFSNYGGTNYWYGDQLNSTYAPGGKGTLITRQINTAGYSNLKFQISLGAKATGTTNWTVVDYFLVNYRVAGGTFKPLLLFRGTAPNNGTGGGTLRRDKDPTTSLTSTTAPIGRQLVAALDTVQAQFPASVNGQTIELQIISTGEDINSEVAFDNLRVSGTPTATVTSIARASANPTNASTVNYTVTFSSAVTGLTAANFSLTTTSTVSGASVGTPVAGSGNTTWTVPVNTGTGSGTLTLNLANDTNLSVDITTTLPFAGETYTIDKTAPTTTITSSTPGVSNGGTTNTTPISFTVTFTENVTGFVQGDVTVGGGTLSGFTAVSGSTYTFNVTPTSSGSTVTVNVAANTAQDAAGNGNTAAPQFSITYQQPLVASSQAVTVQLDANGNATLTASSVNNNSSGSGTLTYTIQKIAFGYIPESTTPLTLTTPNGVNFTQIRFASYGTPNNNGNGNYSLGFCNAANSLVAAQNAYVGRSSGSLYASNTDTRNNPVLGDPCSGTPKALAVQAGYSANAASLTYDCTEAGKTQYVLLTVTNGTNTSTSVAQVTVNPPATATISSLSPNPAPAGTTVTVNGTNLSGVTSVTLNGTPLTTSNVSATRFQVTLPSTATSGSLTVSLPCSQTLTTTLTVTQPTVTAVTGTTPSPTATGTVSYQVTFSASVSGLSASNFNLTTSGLSGASVASVSGSGTTYTVVVNTGTGNGTLTLNVDNSTGVTPTVTGLPYTSGTTYTITKSFAAAPTLRIQGIGSASGNSDVTAFVDVVQVLSGGTAFANGVQNGSFETNNVPPSNYLYQSQGVVATPWTFGTQAGVSRNGSGFGSNTNNGTAVAFLQSAGGNNGSVLQNLAVPTGSYQVTFNAIQRSNISGQDQRLNVFVNDVFVGNIQPTSPSTYDTFTSDAFNVTAPTLNATVSTTSASPTSAAPIPFSVSFTNGSTGSAQSVGTSFTASDVTVAGGTLTSGSFSGSGAGPYTFTVTPSGTGTVSVSVAAGVATDANNTPNSGSNTVSVRFQAPTITVGPASLPDGTQNTAYSQTLTVSGGSGTYGFAITAGALPNGLTLNLSTGTISGTPTVNGTFYFTVTATDNSAAPGPYSGSRNYSLTINPQPVTAAPVLTTPANGSLTNNPRPTYSGTAPANSTVTVYVGPSTASAIGTTTASASGSFSLAQPSALTDGGYLVYATAQTSGSATSAKSNTNSFTVDTTAPTVTSLTSTTVASGSTTSTSPVLFTATFSEPVTGFTSAGIAVSNGTVTSGPTAGSGNTYTFQVTPSGAGNVTVQVRANAAQDQAGNFNPTSAAYAFTFVAPTIVVAPSSAGSPTTLPGGTQGTAYSLTFSASGGSGTYGFAITAGALPNGLTLNLSTGTISGTPTANGTFYFTVTATDQSTAPGPYSGSRNYSLTIAPSVVTWTGNTNTDWFTASNWSPTQVPDATTDAVIPTAPSGGSRFPAITASTAQAQARNLTLNSGATLTMTNGTLTLAADLTNNGTFQPTGGTVVLGNSALSNIFGNGNTRFWNLTVGASGAQQSTSASTSVQRLLVLNGNFTPNGNPFTLESNANNTALVVNNGGVVNGTATVQRYIQPDLNPNMGYRHVAAPISNATVGTLATGSFSPVVNPTYNTSAQPGTVTPFPTVYGYDQSRLATTSNNLATFDKGWYSPTATTNALAVGQGYTVMLAANQTWNFTGLLNNGTLTQTLARNSGATAADAGLQLVGNPYPSPLDLNQLAAADRNNLDQFVAVWASNNPANPYAGAYTYYNNGLGTAGPVVAMGQGFFTRVTPGQTSGTLTFRNSQRVTSYQNPNYYRTAETRPIVQLGLQAASGSEVDNAFVYFEQGATAAFDSPFDAPKIANPSGLNLSSNFAGSENLAINGLSPLASSQVVVPLQIGVPAAGSYTLAAKQLLNLSTTPTYLRDLQTGAVVDLAQQPSYQFTVSNASALITGRFELLFSPAQPLATAPAALVQQVNLYPNPAKATAFLELPASLGRQAVTATLVDAVGRVVRTVSLPAQGAQAHQLDLHELTTGVYALRLTTSAGTIVKRLTVE